MTTPITDLSTLPVILTLDEIAAIYRCGKGTIRRALQNKTFRPEPFERFPYRWLRDDVAEDLKRRRVLREPQRPRSRRQSA